jgi:hypothetical protein
MEYIIITLALLFIVALCVVLIQHIVIKGKDEIIAELEEQPLRLQNTQLKADLELQTSLAKVFEQRYDQLRSK